MASVRAQPWVALEADNLTSLAELTESHLLEAIGDRYRAGLIYTAVGDILVAVNPFQQLPMYDAAWSKAYETSDVSSLAPHVYRVAAAAYNSMVQGKKSQVCVISGESGAGKTESAKFIMKQVMDMCRSAGLGLKLQQKIIQLNPLLEAFGNARTELNDNSSRFGKFIQLLFESNGRIVGAGLEKYLLEKSRICVQGERERNFHIFYYLYAGLSPQKKERLHLKNPCQHRYLQTYCQLNKDCTSDDSKEAFSTVVGSMESIGFSSSEIDQVLTLLAAVLHIGDIEFVCSEERGGDSATIKNPEHLQTVARLLCLENSEELAFALTTLRTVTRGEPVDKLYSCSKAAVVRNAAAKALYARMFQWIISRINTHLRPKEDRHRSTQDDYLNIGILDIFGFENFKANSFEQFCINLANEQLQQYFNHQIFAMEKMECAKEGVEDLDISYTDNTPVTDLFLARPIGLLCLLDEQCKGLNGSEKAFVQRCRESFDKHQSFKPHRGNALEFTVSHYAGDVTYDIDGFLEKNRDSLPDMVAEALRVSSLRLLGTLFSPRSGGGGGGGGGGRGDQLRKSFLRKSQRSVMRAMSQRRRRLSVSPKKKQRQTNRKLLTVSAHFRESLDLLMERLFAASPHFVRCIKPNLQKQPSLFEPEFVLQQLRYTGMLEAVRVRREGFSYRPFFSDFVSSYRAIAYPFTDEDVKLTEATCQVILTKAGLTGWRLARSRVFLRYYHEQKLQLILKAMEDGAILIQRIYRGYRAKKLFKPMKEKHKQQSVQVAKMLSQLTRDGQIHHPLLKALDRTDILEAPQRFKREERPTPTAVGPSSADYEGLSTQQRKVKKAQRLGIKVGAIGLEEEALQAALKSPKRNSRPPTEIETSRPPTDIESSGPPTEIESSGPPTEIESSRPPPPKCPPPRSTKPLRNTPSLSGDELSPLSPSSPSTSASSSPSHTAHGRSSNPAPPTTARPQPSPRRRRRLPQPQESPKITPRSSRPVNVTVIPSGSSVTATTPNGTTHSITSPGHTTTTASTTAGGKGAYTPVPKPRRNVRNAKSGDFSSSAVSDGSQHRRLSEGVLTESRSAADTARTPTNSRRPITAVKSLPSETTSRDSSLKHVEAESLHTLSSNEELRIPPKKKTENQTEQLNHKNSGVATHSSQTLGGRRQDREKSHEQGLFHTAPRRALVGGDTLESTLDFSSNGRAVAPTSRFMYSSVPDLLDESPPVSSPLNTHTHTNGGVYLPNTRITHGMVLSSDNLLNGTAVEPNRDHSGMMSPGGPRSGRGALIHNTDTPHAGKQKGRGLFRFPRISRKKSSSSDSVGSPLPSPARRESDPDVLGYYPSLSYEEAVDMITGQPRGTYVIFKEDLQEYSGQSGVYKLGVSAAGRGVKMYPILCTGNGKWLEFQLVNGGPHPHPPHNTLKSLVEQYKVSELSDGVTLTQPRLVAGIAVTGGNFVRKQQQIPRTRLKGQGRRKH